MDKVHKPINSECYTPSSEPVDLKFLLIHNYEIYLKHCTAPQFVKVSLVWNFCQCVYIYEIYVEDLSVYIVSRRIFL
jgi:hypothetical protein